MALTTINFPDQNPLRQRIFSKRGFGPWAYWQQDLARAGIEMPKNRDERFDLFVQTFSPRVQTGVVHLHANWDQRSGLVYWKVVSQGSSFCKTRPGRCIKAKLEIMEDQNAIPRLQLPWAFGQPPDAVDLEPDVLPDGVSPLG